MSTLTIKNIWLTGLLVFGGLSGALSQYHITGFNPVIAGVNYGPYTISGGTISTTDHWCATNGTLNGTANSCVNNNGTPNVSATWTSSGTLSYYQAGSGTPVATYAVTVYPVNNGIQTNPNQEFFPDFFPFVPLNQLYTLNLTGTVVSVPPGVVTYSWLESTDGTNYTALPNGNAVNYTLTQAFTQSVTYIERTVNVNLNGQNYTNTTSPIMLQAETPIQPGAISPASVSIVSGGVPGTFTAAVGTGGTMCGGNYTYTWQTSTDNVNWTTVGSGLTYTPGAVSQTTYLRILDYCGPMAGVASAEIRVYGPIQAGTIGPINVTVLPGTSAGTLTGNPATGGDAPAGYTYTWQSSSDGVTFTSIPSTNFLKYTPAAGSLTATTYFRRQVSCNFQTANSNISEVLVTATPTAPTNIVNTKSLTAGGITTLGAANALTALTDVKQANQYFDGLGRASQTVAMHGSLVTSSGSNTDMIVPVAYDGMGRKVFDYLPYASTSNTGSYDLTAFPDQQAFNSGLFQPQGDNMFYYGQTNYEPSPLARVNSKTGSGDSWTGANRGDQTLNTSNTATDNIVAWNVSNSGSPGTFGTYYYVSTYGVGALRKTISLDDNGNQIIEFKDLFGNVVLKKVQYTAPADDGSGSGYVGWLCTYYIYDIQNNLRCVIQPDGVQLLFQNGWNINALSGDILNKQSFRYEYDARNRIIEKQIPGELLPEYIVYDNLDRVVMTQTGAMRPNGQWLVTLYESALDRQVGTGMWTNTGLTFASVLSAGYNSASYPFTLTTTPTTGWDQLTLTHYDDYTGVPTGVTGSFNNTAINMLNFYPTANVSPIYAQLMTQVTPTTAVTTHGLVTWTKSEVLGTTGAGTGQYINVSNIYDNRARVIQKQTYNYTLGTDLLTTQYNFAGLPLIQDLRQQEGSTLTYEVATRNTLDALERTTKVEKMVIASGITQAWKTISTFSFDAAGRMVTKTLGTISGSTPIETQANEFNIRGWTIGVNRGAIGSVAATPYFGYELAYDKSTPIVSSTNYSNLQFNGNITGTIWKNAGDQQIKRYDYQYDAANRLSVANFNEYTGGVFSTSAGLNYTVNGISYDANGNLKNMTQFGWKNGTSSAIDALTYDYISNSNQLLNVQIAVNDQNTTLGDFHYSPTYSTFLTNNGGKTSTTPDYTYDNNGNLTVDKNKDITNVTYNFMNLPIVYSVAGSTSNGSITYTYDASGEKLAKQVIETGATVNGVSTTITTTTTYLSGFVYQSLNYSYDLQYIFQEEGRIRALYKTTPNTPSAFAFDYFLKDHLGNTRTVVTDEPETDNYPQLTFEGTTSGDVANQNAIWDNASGLSINVLGNRTSAMPTGFSNQSVFGVECGSITKSQGAIGAAKLLRVMAGDQISASIQATYATSVVDNSGAGGLTTLVNGLKAMLLNAGSASTVMEGTTAANAISAAENSSSSVITFFTTTHNETPQGGTIPQAYLHVLLFNDQFVFDNVNSQVMPVASSALNAQQLLSVSNLTIPKDGYAYIYFSNESNTVVYFDNFNLTDVRGPILETNDYYPFGLTMAATSGTALKSPYVLNKLRYNGKELQNQEFSNGSGLELYDFGARYQDPQLGIWHSIDPKSESGRNISPYVYGFDNPVRFIDPSGMWPDWGDLLKRAAAYVVNKVTDAAINVVASAVNEVRQKAADAVKTLTITPYASIEGTITSGQRYTGDIKKNLGADVNIHSTEVVSAKAEANNAGVHGDLNHAGKDNKTTTSSGASVDYEVGASYTQKTTTQAQSGQDVVVATSQEATAGLAVAPPVNLSVAGSKETEFEKGGKTNSTYTGKAYIGAGWTFGIVWVLDVQIQVGVKAQIKTEKKGD